ncbi:MAG: hypothetical protein IKU42_01840 [Oscillospiraceae bacterium]|nr:hypothetical protein [Oscillospiraceae bacterium]
MGKEHIYVYCSGILGAKTNIKNFKWIFGSIAPEVSDEEYKKCALKFEISVKPEKDLIEPNVFTESFQSFLWEESSKTIFYRRTFPFGFNIGYNIKIDEDTVFVEMGSNYYKIIKNRFMNLHGSYYLLSDLANMLLLKKGYLTLYASSVYFSTLKRGLVCFAAPNTGKTLTATTLCSEKKAFLIGEDVLIFNDGKVFSCPWTNSYRKNTVVDSVADLRKPEKNLKYEFKEYCDLTDVVVLSKGEKEINKSKEDVLKKMNILNGYLFNYYSSPIVKTLGYFDEEYYKPWNNVSEKILEKMMNKKNCYIIKSEDSKSFAEIIYNEITGK